MKKSIHFALVLLTLGASGAAAAAPPITVVGGRPTVHVSYADLNLRNASGIEALSRRIAQAATALCMDNRVKGLKRATAGRACRMQAIESAAPQVVLAISNSGKIRLASSKMLAVSIRR